MRLAVLTDLHGVLEPCGCTRTSAGGADRIAALLTELRQKDRALALIVAGDSLFPALPAAREPARADEQSQLKADAWVEILRRMKLDVVVPGPGDFARGVGALVGLARQSDVVLLGTEAPIDGLERLAKHSVLAVGARRVALSVAGAGGAAADLEIAFRHGEQALNEATPHADLVIHSGLTPPRSFALVRDGVMHVSAGQDGEQLMLLELLPGVGQDAPWQLVSALPSANEQNNARVEQLRLTQEKPADPQLRKLLDQLFARINARNRELAATRDAPKRRAAGGREPPAYMGARTCAACHTEAYFAWRETPHARAYETLVARGRELDLDCIGCHVTGFDQPKGAAIGHLDELRGVGCESCHGPGEAHADNPRARQRPVQRAVAETVCAGCHDAAHSDDFDYATKRQRLLVPGHGLTRAREL